MPQPVTPPQTAAPTPTAPSAPTATEMYEAAQLSRRELRNQVDQLQGERRQLRSQLQQATNQTDIKGIEGRLVATDARIADVEKQLAAADAMVANRAAVPGVVIEAPRRNEDIPPGAMVVSGLGLAMVLMLPLSIAYARRIWRRAAQGQPAIPSDLSDRMANIERGIEAVAIEVERLGEGQRFVTQLLSESNRRPVQALPVERER